MVKHHFPAPLEMNVFCHQFLSAKQWLFKCIELCVCTYVCNKCSSTMPLQVLQDVTAEEFQQFVEVLLQLRTMATRKGAQELVDIVANQADLTSDFQVSDRKYTNREII